MTEESCSVGPVRTVALSGASLEAAGLERPFVGRTDAFIIRAPGGAKLEVLGAAQEGA